MEDVPLIDEQSGRASVYRSIACPLKTLIWKRVSVLRIY